MASASIWSKLEASFHEGAITVEGSSTKQLFSPGVAGLQVLIESEVGSGRVTTEDIENFYKTNDWDQKRSVSWEELRAVVLSLNFPELESENQVEDGNKKKDENTDIEDRRNQSADYDVILAERKNHKPFHSSCLRS